MSLEILSIAYPPRVQEFFQVFFSEKSLEVLSINLPAEHSPGLKNPESLEILQKYLSEVHSENISGVPGENPPSFIFNIVQEILVGIFIECFLEFVHGAL